jgi:hypothetical protein
MMEVIMKGILDEELVVCTACGMALCSECFKCRNEKCVSCGCMEVTSCGTVGGEEPKGPGEFLEVGEVSEDNLILVDFRNDYV